MKTVLDQICDDKRAHIARRKEQTPLAALEAKIKSLPAPRGFIAALRKSSP